MKKFLYIFCMLMFVGSIAKAQTENKYQPPQPVSPAKAYIFSQLDAKKPIVFRWTPLIPKTAADIVYKVTVLEVLESQTPTEALKTNAPLFDKEVTNQTVLIANVGDLQKAWPLSAGSIYAWYITAFTSKGTTIGDNEGRSELSTFKVAVSPEENQLAMMASGANAEFKLDTVYCIGEVNGLIKYHIKATYKNLSTSSNNILINDALPFPGNAIAPAGIGFNLQNNIRTKSGTYNPALTISNILEATNGTISNLVPSAASFPATLVPNSAVTFDFDFVATTTSTMLTFYGLVDDALRGATNKNTRNEILFINQFPPCPSCDYCKESMIVFNGANTITDVGNTLTLTNNISIPGINVKQFKAELIGITYRPSNSNEQCWVCNKDDNLWGNFTSGTLTAPFAPFINGLFPSLPCCGTNSHHTIGWWGNPTVIANADIRLNISLPPMSTLTCCPFNITLCIRYTFTDEKCRSCSVVKCFEYVRKPQIPVIDADESQLILDNIDPKLKQ